MKKYYAAFLLTPLVSYLFDERLVLWQRALSPEVDRLFSQLTKLGASQYYLVPFGIYIVYSWLRKRIIAYKTLYIWLSIALAGIIVQPFKYIIGRARPKFFELEGIYSFKPFGFDYHYNSMPSGHSTTAFALTFALALLYPKYKIPLIIAGCFIAFTRVMVGAHYMSDVYVGSLLGLITALLLIKHQFFKNQINI